MTDEPLVSVIIPVFDDSVRLQLCLDHLKQQRFASSFEIIVVDNGSRESLADVQAAHPDVRWLSEAKPGSYHARNTGISVARGAILAFTDSDCQAEPDWLAAGSAPLSDPSTGFVGGRIDLITTDSGGLSAAEVYDLAVGFPQRRFVEQVHFAMTASMFTRRETMAKVGLFDGSLKSGGDREWGTRAWNKGFPGVYVDKGAIRHPTRSTPAEVLKRIRRVAGGERDRHPGWARCALFCARHLLPPRQAIRDIMAIDPNQVPMPAKLGAILFACRARASLVRHRLALQVGGGESSRT